MTEKWEVEHIATGKKQSPQWMQLKDISDLQQGDMIRPKGAYREYVVETVTTEHPIAVRTVILHRADSWEVLR